MNSHSGNILAQGSIRSFRLSGRSGFLVALVFPVIPAFRSFQLSGGSSCPVIISIVWSFLVPVNKQKI
jgi:hypothetical protein